MRKIENQMNDYLDYCENVRQMSYHTIKNKRWCYQNFIKQSKLKCIEDVSNKQINEWMTSQKLKGCSGRTINSRLVHLKAMLQYFIDTGVAIPNLNIRLITKTNEMPPRRVYYSQQQIDGVLALADQREWLLIKLCYECGFRISELTTLRLSNINGNKITFIGKGSKIREVYISKETRKHLDDWIEDNGVIDYLWLNSYHHSKKMSPVDTNTIRYYMRGAFERAGIKDFYPHALRHSFATNICNNGAPLPIAQRMLGHANVTTTERYVHSFDGHLEEYFNQYMFAAV